MSYRGMGHVIFSLHLEVGHSVLLQLEGVGHVFSNHHISKCSGPPPPVLFGQSLSIRWNYTRVICWIFRTDIPVVPDSFLSLFSSIEESTGKTAPRELPNIEKTKFSEKKL